MKSLRAPVHTLLNTGNIMTEYCYPECTTSVITALAIFRKHYPDYRVADIEWVFSLLLYSSMILTTFEVVRLKGQLSTCMTHRHLRVDGSARGGFASLMRCNLRWRACRSLVRRTRRAGIRGGHVNSSWAIRGRTAGGARATRYSSNPSRLNEFGR